MMKNYVCFLCGRRNVKLWRPYSRTAPLICAECAEKRQTPRKYEEKIWRKRGNSWYEGIPTGKKLLLPKWRVDKNGKIPSCYGPGPVGQPECLTDKLIINLADILSAGCTSMVPACPSEDDGEFWGYPFIPEDLYKWWAELPTR